MTIPKLLIFISFMAASGELLAEEKKKVATPLLRGGMRIKGPKYRWVTEVHLPLKPNGFDEHPSDPEKLPNWSLIQPFKETRYVREFVRFINPRFTFINIVQVTGRRKFDPEWATMKAGTYQDMAKQPVIVELAQTRAESMKRFGEDVRTPDFAGFFYQVKHFSNGRWFRKWISAFGDKGFSALVVVVLPMDQEKIPLARELHDMVKYAGLHQIKVLDEEE